MSIRRLSLLLLLVAGCSAQEDKKPEAPVPVPERSAPLPRASIASVLMMEDCPDPVIAMEEARAAKEVEAEEADSAGDSYEQPCTQSTLQVAFAGQGSAGAKVALKELRLLGPGDKRLAILKTRLPTVWRANAYQGWDQLVPANADLQVSYKVSPPDWSAVEAMLETNSFGTSFVLEVDLDIAGTVTTLRSTPFQREHAEMIET